jgi:hypothetical protein
MMIVMVRASEGGGGKKGVSACVPRRTSSSLTLCRLVTKIAFGKAYRSVLKKLCEHARCSALEDKHKFLRTGISVATA